MADDNGYLPKMHRDDFEALVRELRRGPAADPPMPDRPPAQATGRDAAFFREIVHDECEKLYERFRADQERLFRRLRMPIDEEHINETSDALGEVFELNKTLKEMKRSIWKDAAASAIKWLVGGGALAAAISYVQSMGKTH